MFSVIPITSSHVVFVHVVAVHVVHIAHHWWVHEDVSSIESSGQRSDSHDLWVVSIGLQLGFPTVWNWEDIIWLLVVLWEKDNNVVGTGPSQNTSFMHDIRAFSLS